MIGPALIVSGYAALAVLAIALVRHTHRASRPDASPAAYLTTVMSNPVGRWLVLLLWLWVGWHFFVR
jgi:hypothetical protein